MENINLNELKAGFPGISRRVGAFLAEGCAVCLENNGHQSGTIIKISGDYEQEFQLFWTDVIDHQISQSWKDENEATEYGATALAILLIYRLTGFYVMGRATQISGADYTLRKDQYSVGTAPQAYLEVSGIFF